MTTAVNRVDEGARRGVNAYGRTTVGQDEHPIIARVDGRRPPAKGETVHFTPKLGHTHLFSTTDGSRLAG